MEEYKEMIADSLLPMNPHPMEQCKKKLDNMKDVIVSHKDLIDDDIKNLFKECFEITESMNDKDFVPIYGITKSYSFDTMRNDGTPKEDYELQEIKFGKMIKGITIGDVYSHALVSLDSSMTKMYSFEDAGFTVDNILTSDSWMGTKSIYICVMFIEREQKRLIKEFIEDFEKNQSSTKYAYSNLLKAYIAKPSKIDKRLVCSTFTGLILSIADKKNAHRDYSRLRPEDITILPRAFYVGNYRDKEDFKARKDEIKSKVINIYKEYKEEINEYNNMLPKILFKDRVDKLKFSDKILDWVSNHVL